jgi:hypothetical protein
MNAADQRLAELLERWMTSVELHARYLALDDAAYARVQDWPEHQRPSRWVVELARTRLLELKRLADERQSRGDTGFADALETMAFLTGLLGSEHVERFIPLAQPRPARPDTPPPRPAPTGPAEATETTRPLRAATAPKPRRAEPPRAGPRPPPPTRAARSTTPPTRRQAAPVSSPAPANEAVPDLSDKAQATVIADAVRLVSWGREWPQLASLIARLADRPPEAEVWKILRKHRAEIETRARKPRD